MRRENVAIVFPGQGSQCIGMGKDLYDNFQVAREVFDEVDEAIGQNLSKLMFDGDKDELNLTENTQPAIMAVSVAAYRVLADHNKAYSMEDLCAVTAGHSLGEYSALCAAGSISLSDTAKLLKARGKAMQKAVPLGKGGMSALLGIDFDTANQIAAEAEKFGVCDVANDNCIGQIVISGDIATLEHAEKIAAEHGCKRAIRLAVSAPFHCKLMDPAAKVMEEELAKVKILAPAVPVVANYTARPNLSQVQILPLLVGQVSNVVRWTESVKTIFDRYDTRNFIEVGPGKVLNGLVNRILMKTNFMNLEKTSDLNTIPNII